MKKRFLLTSLLTIALCFSLICGASFALFTNESSVNVAVTYGKVDVTARAENFKVYSGKWNDETKEYESVLQDDLTFATLGTVSVVENNIIINNMAAMDKVTFDIVIENNSTISAMYQTIFTSKAETEGKSLLDELSVSLVENSLNPVSTIQSGNNVISNWTSLTPVKEGEDKSVTKVNVEIMLPENVNINQGVAGTITFTVNTVQGNAHVENPKVNNENETYIYTVADLKDFADSVNSGNNYSKKTVKLMTSLDLNNEEWTPIGNSSNKFSGTFDGNGFIISNLNINKPNSSNVGLFGFTTNGLIKNLTVENAAIKGRLNVGVVAGTPYTSKYENIKVIGNVTVDGMSYVGGVLGKNAYADLTNITVNVNEGSYVKADSVENGTAYRTYVGGVVGFMGEGNITLSNIVSNIDVIGSTVDVGGITGIAHYNNKLINCVCSGDVTLLNADEERDAKEIGGIAGVWHNSNNTTVTFIDCKFTGTLSSTFSGNALSSFENNGLVGMKYSDDGTGKLIIIDSTNIKSQDELEVLNGTGIQAVVKEGTTLELNDCVYNNPVKGKAAIVNNGTLIITNSTLNNGAIASANGSHVIENTATGVLTINSGSFGTDEESGSAIRNNGGTVVVNGGTFASCDRSMDKYGDYTDTLNKPYRYAYVFVTNGGTMTINDATVDCNPHGMFSAINGGTLTVNGGNYKMAGNGTTYYMAYAVSNSKIELLDGNYEWNSGDTIVPAYIEADSTFNVADTCVKTGHNNWVNYTD